jgi:hypothetical protein
VVTENENSKVKIKKNPVAPLSLGRGVGGEVNKKKAALSNGLNLYLFN